MDLGRRTSDSDNSFLARQIGDMDKGIIERSEDMSNSKDKFSLPDLRTEAHDLFFAGDLLLWWLERGLAYKFWDRSRGVKVRGEGGLGCVPC
jgi:hypothetical protein